MDQPQMKPHQDSDMQEKPAETAYEELLRLTEDPMKAQKGFLMKLLADNKDTEYGKKFDFAGIGSIEEFQKKVPLSAYDDYASYIERMTQGERNLITAYPMMLYNKTSGTSGSPKKVPLTLPAVQVFTKYTLDYLVDFLNKEIGEENRLGRMINVVQAADTHTMPDGLEYGSVSDYFMSMAIPTWDSLYVTPYEATFASPGTNIRYLQARYALSAEDPVTISCTFSSFASEFFRYIENNWEMLVNDIEHGAIDPSVEMPEAVKANLLKKTEPMPARAAELREIFSQGFDEPFVPKVWPRLKHFASAMTGSFKVYSELIRKRYFGDSVRIFARGVAASEGTFTMPVALDSYDSVLLPDSVFFEFAPMKDGEPDYSDILTLDRLEQGKEYELIITNLSGYYRYRMRDVFLVTGMYRHTPMIEFRYRSDKTISILGEKSTEDAVKDAAVNAAAACGFRLIDSTVYPDYDNLRYVFLMEIDKVPASLTEERLREELEKALAQANPSMGDKVKKGLCRPTQVQFIQPETFLLWRDLAILRGASPGQQKPVTVITNEAQKSFFFSLTEDFEEAKHRLL